MKIVIAHNRYRIPGGEDTVVRDEHQMLATRGHQVQMLAEDNDAIVGLRSSLDASASIFYSPRSRQRMGRLAAEFQPDLLHVHNWFPRLSPSIIYEADARGIPVVQSLHNYRMSCAGALLFRDGAICTNCLGRALPLDGIRYGCYRGSRAGSAVVTAAYAAHRLLRTWRKVDLFIAVSQFQRSLLIEGGIPADQIVAKPNLIAARPLPGPVEKQDLALFVGRLSEEKGLGTLLAAWRTGRVPLRLRIIGEGPLASMVRAETERNPQVEYAAAQPPDQVRAEMAQARFLVSSSECYETFGKVVVEAFAQGTPVLAADLGNMKELVQEGVTGYRYAPGNAEALVEAALRFPAGGAYMQMCEASRAFWAGNFTEETNYPQLMAIYQEARMRRQARR